MHIAQNLKALRKEKEWTQEEVAETLGVSPQSVSKWERGDTCPDISLLPALSNMYKVSIDSIIGMDKINEAEAIAAVFKAGQRYLRNGNSAAAAEVYTAALKTHPSDEALMTELALVLSLEDDPAALCKAANLFEKALLGKPSEKVQHTIRAARCFVYFKLGEEEKALSLAKKLPHVRESRENVLAVFMNEPKPEKIDAYLRLISLGEEAAC
ncbi:MAG: helix-turn-helix transcriptional regulator [Defluviitaleaceae bacterium]|nr:helix-turn-helix transcriptional regulator [Defluviitaleaceae bacterium]